MDDYSTLSPDFSSTLFALTSAIDATTRAISALSQHPYDYAKSLYFEEGHVFPTFKEVEVPSCITPEALIESFEKRHNEYQDTVVRYITSPSDYDLTNSNNQVNLLCTLSSDNKFVITDEKQAEYLTTLETLQSLKLDDVTDENSEEIALKIGYLVNKVFKV